MCTPSFFPRRIWRSDQRALGWAALALCAIAPKLHNERIASTLSDAFSHSAADHGPRAYPCGRNDASGAQEQNSAFHLGPGSGLHLILGCQLDLFFQEPLTWSGSSSFGDLNQDLAPDLDQNI